MFNVCPIASNNAHYYMLAGDRSKLLETFLRVSPYAIFFYCTYPRRADDNMAIIRMVLLIAELISALKMKKIRPLLIE